MALWLFQGLPPAQLATCHNLLPPWPPYDVIVVTIESVANLWLAVSLPADRQGGTATSNAKRLWQKNDVFDKLSLKVDALQSIMH
jgi:hypothetical protein